MKEPAPKPPEKKEDVKQPPSSKDHPGNVLKMKAMSPVPGKVSVQKQLSHIIKDPSKPTGLRPPSKGIDPK